MVLAFDHLKKRFRRTNDVLILGTGLGSAVHILYNKGFKPNYTLVEHDEKIIEWADALLPEDIKSSVIKVCEDADTFMKGCKSQYDLIVADVFNSRDVPEFVTSQSYLQHCRRCIRPGGAFVLNYIVVNENTWRRAEQQVLNIFPACEILHNGINRILIATV
jgi:spermidine synthase